MLTTTCCDRLLNSLSLCQDLFNYFVEEEDMRVSTLFATVGTVGLLAGSLVVGQVHADDNTVTVSDAATAIASVSAVIGASAPETKTADGFVANINGSTAELPKDPSDGLTLTTPTGAVIGVDLPFADTANDGVKTKTGAVVYADAAPDVAVAAQATAGGGMRALVVIDGPQAPTEYRYPMTLPDTATLLPTTDGGAAVISADGQLVTYVAPAWALDTNGQPVPTRYRIEGTTLIQEIDHQGATYPVTADPCWSCIGAFVGGLAAGLLVASAVCAITAGTGCLVAAFGAVGVGAGSYKTVQTGDKTQMPKQILCWASNGVPASKPLSAISYYC